MTLPDIDFSTWQIIAILMTYIIASIVKGITGLGFSTTCLPFLAVIVGLKEALPLVIIPSVISNLAVMRTAGHFRETLSRFWPMLLATIPGLILGLWVLSGVDGKQAGGVLGAILLLWCAFTLGRPAWALPNKFERPLQPISGFLTGTINGITGSQVVPSVPFLMGLGMGRNQFIQAVNCSFTLSSFIMAFGLNRLGLFDAGSLAVSVFGACLISFGLRFGESIRDRMSPTRFRQGVLFVLIAMSVSLLCQAFGLY